LVACLKLRSFVDFVLGVYIVGCALVIALCFSLSPAHALTTRSTLAGSLGLLGVAALVWWLRGRPPPPTPRRATASMRVALRDRLLRVLGVVAVAAFGYSLVLAVLTAVNDGDALWYHLARAAFWHQQDGVSYVSAAVDPTLNGHPPNAEIEMLFTMLLAGSDRYVALPQLAAYVALLISVAGLGRRARLDTREALFGALLLGLLPVVLVQASTALNDAVVASFLTTAAYFALRSERAALVLFALAFGLALGTKLTSVIATPVLAGVIVAGRPRRDWPRLAIAGVAGSALGSLWYWVNLIESGRLDGGLGELDQRAEASPTAVAVSLARLLLDVFDMSGTPWPHAATFAVVGAALVLLAAKPGVTRSRRITLAEGGLLAMSPLLTFVIFGTLQDFVFRTWAALGRPVTPPFEFGWNLNVVADPSLSWFGPAGALLLFGGAVSAIALWRRGTVSSLIVVYALAPFVLMALMAATVVWDANRGRFFIFGVALAASAWGLLLRVRALAIAAVAMVSITASASVLNYQGKPSGIGALVGLKNQFNVSVRSVWTASRPDVQAWLRPDTSEGNVLRFVEEAVPQDATIAVAPRQNDFLSPYFGPRLSRHVLLVRPGEDAPADAEWLVISPSTTVLRCAESWQTTLELESGWRVVRRVAPDLCR
jgi:hypothetical protein